jgi:hypothetical protein
MRVFLTGATGFLGRALTLALKREGHTVLAWVRSPERARMSLGDQAEPLAMDGDEARLVTALETCDAVVNLAGEPVLSRWTARRRVALRASRVDLTARLVAALARARRRPRVLVSGSAVGVYGDRGDELLDEDSAPGSDFLARLSVDWEAAARRAEGLGLRVVLVRTGVVLGLDGGALVTMLPPFRFGAGGRLGSGRQRMPWIHVEDWVRAVCAALVDERYRGPLNLTAPEPPTNREYTRALAGVLAKPAFFPVPGLALKLLFGAAARILLDSQRAQPARLVALGFVHRFATLDAALRDLLVDERARLAPLAGSSVSDESPYLAARPATHELAAECELGVPLTEAFTFFSAPENLAFLTPRPLGLEILARSGAPSAGSTVDYRIRIGPIPLRWRTRFERWEAPARFVDVQERGPYRTWWHEHRFEARGARTVMRDRVRFTLPLGPLGALARRLFVADQLGDLFRQRALAIRLRFGAPRVNAPERVPSA